MSAGDRDQRARDRELPIQSPTTNESDSATVDKRMLAAVQRRLMQRRGQASVNEDPARIQEIAASGVAGAATPLPHLETLQAAFGPAHDLSTVRAHVGGSAGEAAAAIGAEAYATGDSVAFQDAPSLHLAAHEVAHVIQQRSGLSLKGGVGEVGDSHERQADAVADTVASGHSASALLDDAHASRSVARSVHRKEEAAENPVVPSATPEIVATDEQMGKHMVDRMDEANDHSHHEGIHYAHNYEFLCKHKDPNPWKDEYRMGYNASGHFINPFEKGVAYHWELKRGHSASQAIQAWLKGLTVAECNSSVVAMEIDTLRAALGEQKFDSLFGSGDPTIDGAIPEHRRMRVHPGARGTPVETYMKNPDLTKKEHERTAKGQELTEEDKDTLLKPGEWYYFYNHPKYLLKHPGGVWQGENSLYMGKIGGQRMWSGLGASNVPEEDMLDNMVSAYNAPRDKYDERAVAKHKDSSGAYRDPLYDPASGSFEDEIDKEKLFKAAAYTINGTTRKGGFRAEYGQTLDAGRVKKTREGK